jgi:hypothetical protein
MYFSVKHSRQFCQIPATDHNQQANGVNEHGGTIRRTGLLFSETLKEINIFQYGLLNNAS